MPSTLKGKIVSVDASGNLVTDIAAAALSDTPTDEQTSIACGGHVTCGIFPANHGQPEMTFLAILGDSGQLELTLVGDDIQAFLGLHVGLEVVVKW